MSFNSASIIHCRFIKSWRKNAARLGNFPFHCLQSFYRITSIKWRIYSFCNQTNHHNLSSFSFWLNWTMMEVHLIECLRQQQKSSNKTDVRGIVSSKLKCFYGWNHTHQFYSHFRWCCLSFILSMFTVYKFPRERIKNAKTSVLIVYNGIVGECQANHLMNV